MARTIVCVWLPNWAVQHRTVRSTQGAAWGTLGDDESARLSAGSVERRTENRGRERSTLAARSPAFSSTQGAPSRTLGASPSGASLVLYETTARGSRVVACSSRVAGWGVMPGQPLAEAQAIVEQRTTRRSPPPRFEVYNLDADVAALRALARIGEQFTPLFGIEESERPESVLLDVTGCTHLFGGEPALLAAVADAFQARGYAVQVALAPTIGAAWAAARCLASLAEPAVVEPNSLAETLAPLPVEALRIPAKMATTLRELGLTTIGLVRGLPRSELPSRFGPLLLERLDQAWGDAPELFAPEHPSDPPAAVWKGEYPLGDRPSLHAVCRGLLDELLQQLQPRRQGLRRLRCELRPPSGKPHEFSIGFVVPTDAFQHVLEMLALQWERAALPEEVESIRLEAALVDALERRQHDLFGGDLDGEKSRRDVNALLDRLSNRLGDDAVVRARLLPEAQPELAVKCAPALCGGLSPDLRRKPHESQARPRRIPGADTRRESRAPRKQAGDEPLSPEAATMFRARPLWLFPPQPVDGMIAGPDGAPASFTWRGEHRVVRCWGPERIRTGWWRAVSAQRDYYRIEVETGHHLWLFRRLDQRDWFVHGAFE